MKIKFLGTASSEGFPAIFCNCKTCLKARELKGKNLRSRSQVLVNGDVLIDFPSDSYLHSLKNEINFSNIKTLLITHSHFDHFYPSDLILRNEYNSYKASIEFLSIFCNERVKALFDMETTFECSKEVYKTILFNIITPYAVFEKDHYIITPIPVVHTASEQSYIFLITKNGKTYLHGTDTQMLKTEIYDYLEKTKVHIDLAVFDCTFGTLNAGYNGHLNFQSIVLIKQELLKRKIIDSSTQIAATHFSHVSEKLHEDFEKIGNELGITICYDGLEIEI